MMLVNVDAKYLISYWSIDYKIEISLNGIIIEKRDNRVLLIIK